MVANALVDEAHRTTTRISRIFDGAISAPSCRSDTSWSQSFTDKSHEPAPHLLHASPQHMGQSGPGHSSRSEGVVAATVIVSATVSPTTLAAALAAASASATALVFKAVIPFRRVVTAASTGATSTR